MHPGISEYQQQQQHQQELVVNEVTPPEKSKINSENFSVTDDTQPPISNESTAVPSPCDERDKITTPAEQTFEGKIAVDGGQSLMESRNLQQTQPYLPVYSENLMVPSPYEKVDELKMKKVRVSLHYSFAYLFQSFYSILRYFGIVRFIVY